MPGSEANITASDAGDAVDELLRFERLLADVSSRFIDLPHDRIDEAIDDGLRQIVTALGTDRSTLLDVDPKSGRVVSTHSWAAPGFHTYAKGDLPPTYPWALTRLRAGLPVVFSRPDELPAEAAVDRAWYESIGQVSHVAVPVMVSRQLIAVLTFGTLRKERTWSGDLVGRLQLLGTVFAGALARKRAQDRVDELLRFERLMTGQSVRLAESSGRNLDVDVNAALRDVAALLAADRCVLWDLFLAPVRATVTHHWTAEIPAASSAPTRRRGHSLDPGRARRRQRRQCFDDCRASAGCPDRRRRASGRGRTVTADDPIAHQCQCGRRAVAVLPSR